ncbi:receptor-like protein kinase 2 [Solanum pennellii]|uniref:Receptor-like protein kinase 2 n=1 Tax=Solanum pennellii TaxID=28526 RepID=A0ABM1GQD4_SOLPN|nr:receptor-like protein kinase 2 [Solanum pennellii]
MSSKLTVTLFFSFLNISFLFPTSISGLNQEGVSLLSWLSTFNSSSATVVPFSSWNPSHVNPCKWDYIQCTSNGFVSDIKIRSINLPAIFPSQLLSFPFLEVLVLSNCNLTGEIPASIGNLSSSLRILDLSFNALTGSIPPEIGRLSQLKQLLLSSNFFQGQIPKEIGRCSELQQLELFDNQFTGKIPEEIGQLTSLEIFRAGGNVGIQGEIPMQISSCKKLVILGLADTGVTGQIPHSIGELKKLQTLAVYTANLTGEIPPEIGNCTSLEELFVYENQITGEIPRELGLLKNLKKVLLWKNNLTGEIPGNLGNCSSLKVIDFSLNYLYGKIPPSFENLATLEELLLSGNSISGEIPYYIGNFSSLKQLELDNNNISGVIPPTIGKLKELNLFFAWQNQLHGSIPTELADCQKLQSLDLSHNFLTGSIPNTLFNLRNLTNLLLISNVLSGGIPPDIGNCTSLSRLRLGSNRLDGPIPPEIGRLPSLSYLELSQNQFTGSIPPAIGNCPQLEMVDLHGNNLQGTVPSSFVSLTGLNILDLSMNKISGNIPEDIGKLPLLNKLILNGNNIDGTVPKSLGLCQDLQLLDLSSNRLAGLIPEEIGNLQGLDILFNLSRNFLTGQIPESFSNLSKLANMDISHNMLTGSLRVLSNLDNLVSLNVSYNNFSGDLPNTKFFQGLPPSAFIGNQELCTDRAACHLSGDHHGLKFIKKITIAIVLSIFMATLIVTASIAIFIRTQGEICQKDDEENGLQWEFTPFRKLSFSVTDVVPRLSESNIVGKGCSSFVYRVETPSGQVIAVKKLLAKKIGEAPQRDFFSAEVRTLGSIRHKNIVRLLGCCNNGKTRLLLFDYISNGSLSGLLHEKRIFLDWDARFNIILGAAQGLAYLHHDCSPPIVHRDIKTNNILVGPQFEAFLADFGLAKLLNTSSDTSRASTIIAGSYGYIAPEYGYSLRITEKSDVYSYGIVLLEILTGMEPTDSRIPEGTHIVTWVNQELRVKHKEFTTILDQQLLLRSGTQTQEMLQVLGVALLCVNPCANERPTMKDVAAMLMEIRHENEDIEKPNRGVVPNPKEAISCPSFSGSSQPLIRSPPQ